MINIFLIFSYFIEILKRNDSSISTVQLSLSIDQKPFDDKPLAKPTTSTAVNPTKKEVSDVQVAAPSKPKKSDASEIIIIDDSDEDADSTNKSASNQGEVVIQPG